MPGRFLVHLFVAGLFSSLLLANAEASTSLGTNLLSNGSFETPNIDGSMPEGWSLAASSQTEPAPIAYPDASQPEWADDPGPRTGDRYLQFVVDSSAEGLTKIVRDSLIPVESDTDYRLQMAYRFQDVDETAENIHLSRLWFGVRHYYDANPGGEPDPQFFEPQIDYVDSLCCGSTPPAETTKWRLVEEDIRFESVGYEVDGVVRQVAWIQLDMVPNDWVRGILAVDDLSLTELASAELDPPASSLSYDFVMRTCDSSSANSGTTCISDVDCPGKDTNDDGELDTEGSCVMNATSGFTAVPFNRQFSGEGGGEYGFEFEDISNPPLGYNRSDYPTRFLGSHLSRNARFRVKLDPGDYRVSVFMGGYWRSDPAQEQRILDFNGERLIDERVNWTEPYSLQDYWYFKNIDATLVTSEDVSSSRRGYAVYDNYIAPRYRHTDLTVTVSDDGDFANLLEIANAAGFMSGVVITPIADLAEHDAAITAFDATLADDFVTHFAIYRSPEEFGLPTVEGDYQPTSADQDRGYKIFGRHWMDFVEFNSKPEVGEPELLELSVAATPGEFEPVTFSVWPLQQLENATVTVSDLQTGGGEATISGEAVDVWYLQQKPRRDGTTFSFVGVYLPDWGTSRTLYPDMTQRAWLNVKVPEDAASGLYTGQVTFAADGVAPTVLSLQLEVRPFSLKRPPHVRSLRGAGGSKLILNFDSSDPDVPGEEDPPIHNREYYRKAAYQDLYDHGFTPDISPYFAGPLSGGFWDADGNFDWTYGTIGGSGNDLLDRFDASPLGSQDTIWIDGNFGRVLEAFEGDPESDWDQADVARWLAGIEAKLHDERGMNTIYLHATAEESHYAGSAWTNYLDFVRTYRQTGYQDSGAWSHVYSAHTSNTNWGQPLAIDHADFPFLGMFHGVSVPAPSEQIAAAQASGKPYGLYGMRGRFGAGFYTWKSGATGSFHEFYDLYAGALNDDWDASNPETSENPGWTIATYSPTGRMIGTWYWEELREGVDDDAYLATLDYWIGLYNCEENATEACANALTARQTVSDAIDLDMFSSTGDSEQLGSTGRYSRTGLSLDRPIEPAVFDALRDQAAEAIAGLIGPDSDGDGIPDELDNCLDVANPKQEDANFDGYGNYCDADFNDNGFVNAEDFAPWSAAYGSSFEDENYDPAADLNANGLINSQDYTIYTAQYNQGVPGPSGLVCAGAAPGDPDYPCRAGSNDQDGDGVIDTSDTCPTLWNPTQVDICSVLDPDQDGILEDQDNCLEAANPSQEDADFDGYGNHCDADFNDNGAVNTQDYAQFLGSFNSSYADEAYLPVIDLNANGAINTQDYAIFSQQYNSGVPGPSGLVCAGAVTGDGNYPCRSRSDDADGDGIADGSDNCPNTWNPAQEDACSDPDSDADGIADSSDNCPELSNPDQLNLDGDAEGDVCDLDIDGDFLPNAVETGTGVMVDETDTGTDPLNPDSDGDGVIDGAEVVVGRDPNFAEAAGVPSLSLLGLSGLVMLMVACALGRLRRRR